MTTTAVNSAVTAQATQQADTQKAAKQLEAFFLRRLLAEARPQGGMLDGGFAGDTFKQMLDEAIADKMSSAGGIGMATMFEKQLGDGTGTKASLAQVAPLSPHNPPMGLPMPRTEVPHIPPIDGDSKLGMPTIGRLSSSYGMRTDPINHTESLHPGLDVAAKTGTPVVAAAAGTVTHAGPAGTYGNLVTIKHENGLETRYAHLSSVDVQKGATVSPGTPIGKVGSTGRSTGAHLHFEVREDGKLRDPAAYLPLNKSGK